MLIFIVALLAACISVLAHDNHQTRKALHTMSKALDDVNAALARVQASVGNVQALVTTLETNQGTPDAALEPVTAGLNGIKESLDRLTAPKA